MKKIIITAIMVALFASGSALRAQNQQEGYLGLPGDNLNLYAVMNLFQNSKTLEDFEKSLNDENSTINNLDLNGDNQVDYIRVVDNVDGNIHNIVLQDAISPHENQDVAVFTVQRFNNGQVQIQLTGDEELYGKNYVIEPIMDAETANPGYTGNDITYVRTTPAEIAVWPVVRFIYLPTYTRWHSTWYWGYYPNYWHPWHPVYWHYYYGYQSNWNHIYYSRYHENHAHHLSGWNDFYYSGRRTYSPEVSHRITSGSYKSTYTHPDQRKEGDAMFAKAHPDQYRTIHSSIKSNGRPTDVSSSHRPDNNSGNHNGNNNSSGKPVMNNNTKTSGRPAVNNNSNPHESGRPVVNNNNSGRPAVNNGNSGRPAGNNSTVSRSSTTTVTHKTEVTRPNNNSGANRSSSTVTTTHSNAKPSNNGPQQNARPASQSKSTTVTSSSRKTKQESSNSAQGRRKDSDKKSPDEQ